MTITKNLPTHYVQWHRRRLAGAVGRFRQSHSGNAEWLLGLLFARHWLAREVHPHYRSAIAKGLTNAGYSPEIVPLLKREEGNDDATFIGQCLQHPCDDSTGNALLPSSPLDHEKKIQEVLQMWQGLRLFTSTRQQTVRQLRAEEKAIMLDLGGPQDRERVKLIDSLEDPASENQSFYKMAFIPRLSCPQSCRHCMLIWRPSLKTTSDCGTFLETINSRTTNLLFTGGDLTKDLDLCYHAIATMNRVEVFAIFLNGHLAQSQSAAQDLFTHLRSALDRRPASFPKANVILQISFDEYHQEIVADRRGELSERIPITNIARLIVAGARAGSSDCHIALIHKQNSLNFSTQLFQTGVFGRLAAELEQMGWKINGIKWLTSPRPKEHPARPKDHGGVIREAKIDISGPMQTTISLISSCIDSLGHAAVLDRSEYVHERLLLESWIQGQSPPMDPFDTDPMLWRDGTVTLFDALYLWMGNFLEEGDRVFARFRKDPLRLALEHSDRRLLIAYQEWDSQRHQQLLQTATSPHGLLCTITRESGARLFLTRWLLDNTSGQSSNP